MRIILTAALLLAITSSARAEEFENHICVTEESTGFSYNEELGKWVKSNFEINDKYIIRKPTPKEVVDYYTWRGVEPKYVVGRFGLTIPAYYCAEIMLDEVLLCDHRLWGEFKFNLDTLRFLTTYTAGFIEGENKAFSNTPLIEIGTCTKF